MLIRYWSKKDTIVVTKAITFQHSNVSLNQSSMAAQIRKGIESVGLDYDKCIARHHDTLVYVFRFTSIILLN